MRGVRRVGVSGQVPLLAAVLLVAGCADDDIFDGAVHKRTKAYLQALADGQATGGFRGTCDGAPAGDVDRALAEEGPGFRFAFTSSTESGASAEVNVTVTGADGTGDPYHVSLRKEAGTWVVCGVARGSVQIDIE